MWIARKASSGAFLGFPVSVGSGFSAEQAAASLGWQYWQEITEEEAARLQAPTRIEAIVERILALEAAQTPRMLRGAALGALQDIARLQAIESQIAELREELAGFA